MNKIVGLKKCVGSYKRLNSKGRYSPHYGIIMFDLSSSEIWTDEFYSLGHRSWKEYTNRSIIPLFHFVNFATVDVNMYNVQNACEGLLLAYRALGLDLFLSTYGLQKMEVFS